MLYNQMIASLPLHWKRQKIAADDGKGAHLYDQLVEKKNLSQDIYRKLTMNTEVIPNRAQKLSDVLGEYISEDELHAAFSNLYSLTNVAKLRSFQYRLLNNAVVLNSHLYKWKISSTSNCTFCGEYKETIPHILYECTEVKTMWGRLEGWMQINMPGVINISLKNIVLNKISVPKRNIKNFICLVVKQFIYRQRCASSSVKYTDVLRYIKSIESVEKFNAVKTGNLQKHKKKWCPYSNALK